MIQGSGWAWGRRVEGCHLQERKAGCCHHLGLMRGVGDACQQGLCVSAESSRLVSGFRHVGRAEAPRETCCLSPSSPSASDLSSGPHRSHYQTSSAGHRTQVDTWTYGTIDSGDEARGAAATHLSGVGGSRAGAGALGVFSL